MDAALFQMENNSLYLRDTDKSAFLKSVQEVYVQACLECEGTHFLIKSQKYKYS